jgi:hypothetical protein
MDLLSKIQMSIFFGIYIDINNQSTYINIEYVAEWQSVIFVSLQLKTRKNYKRTRTIP